MLIPRVPAMTVFLCTLPLQQFPVMDTVSGAAVIWDSYQPTCALAVSFRKIPSLAYGTCGCSRCGTHCKDDKWSFRRQPAASLSVDGNVDCVHLRSV